MNRFAASLLGATLLTGLAVSASAQTQGVSDDRIVVGTHTALTGPVAPWGTGSTNAIRMRFDEANQEGINGRTIEYIVEDTGYQVPRAVQAANKLLNRDQIFAMIGALGTPMNNAVLDRQLGKNVANFAPFTAARSMGEPFHKLKFVGLSTYYDQIRAGIRHLVRENNRSKVCAIYQDTDFGKEILEGTRDQLESMDMELVLAVGHRPTEREFTGTITRLRNAGCDLVTMGTIISDAIVPYVTARRLGWNDVDFLASVASYALITGERAGDGLYAMTSFELIYADSPDATERQKEWAAAYEERFGRPHNGAAQLGYIYADVFVEGLKRAGRELTVDSFVSGLEQIRDYDTGLGNAPISFSANNHQGANQAFLAVTEGGKWRTVTPPLSY